MRRLGLAGLSLLMLSGLVSAGPEIEAQALFNGGAMLVINGERAMLRHGQTGPAGVTLVEATSTLAVVEVDGQRYELELSSRISASFESPEAVSLTIPRDSANRYMSNCQINGRTVLCLVDTGANVVAMSTQTAKRLGIDYENKGLKGLAQTAGGVVNSYEIQLDSVAIGGIKARHITAAVTEGSQMNYVLLGMSFLRHTKLREDGGILTLEQ